MLDCRGGSELSMPLCLLSEYVCSKILSETDPQNLEITMEITRLMMKEICSIEQIMMDQVLVRLICAYDIF